MPQISSRKSHKDQACFQIARMQQGKIGEIIKKFQFKPAPPIPKGERRTIFNQVMSSESSSYQNTARSSSDLQSFRDLEEPRLSILNDAKEMQERDLNVERVVDMVSLPAESESKGQIPEITYERLFEQENIEPNPINMPEQLELKACKKTTEMETPVDLVPNTQESPFGFAVEDSKPEEMPAIDLDDHDGKLGDFFSLEADEVEPEPRSR
jgi:hypothetical protein